jgi:hypothetical protein
VAVELPTRPTRPEKPKATTHSTPVRNAVDEIGEITKMSGASVAGLIHTPRYGSEALHHAANIIKRASLLVFMRHSSSSGGESRV